MEAICTASLNAHRHSVLHRAALVIAFQSVRQLGTGGRRTAENSITSEFITGRLMDRLVGRSTARNVATVTAKTRSLPHSVAN
jgi:hypothetical protein